MGFVIVVFSYYVEEEDVCEAFAFCSVLVEFIYLFIYVFICIFGVRWEGGIKAIFALFYFTVALRCDVHVLGWIRVKMYVCQYQVEG